MVQPDEGSIATARMMISLVRQSADGETNLEQTFLCYWLAWQSICISLITKAGHHPTYQLRKNGTLITRRTGSLRVARVSEPGSDDLLSLALSEFDETLKDRLIRHKGTFFFAHRNPTWQAKPLQKDGFGQQLNGVINVSHTLSPKYPVWSPVDLALYRPYMQKEAILDRPNKTRKVLAGQILDLLHTIHHNLLLGTGKQEPENGDDVVKHGLALLSLIVNHFLNADSQL